MSFFFTKIPLFFLSVLFVLLTFESSSSPNPKPKTLRLIHKDSIHSQRSGNVARNPEIGLNLEHIIEPEDEGQIFLVRLEFGYPYVIQYLGVDTGSRLPWVYCPPCDSCGRKFKRLYDPSNSEVMKPLGCNDLCYHGGVPYKECLNDICHYSTYYGSDVSVGYIVQDEINTLWDDIGMTYFGCSHASKHKDKFNGVLGLGMGNLSVLSQWNYTKFSYCFSNISNANDPNSTLVMGEIEELGGNSTPFVTNGTHYYITPLDISLGGVMLLLDFKVLAKKGLIVDTGSTYTYFPLEIVADIEDSIELYITGKLKRVIDPPGFFRLCYYGVLRRDLHLPIAKIYLAKGAYLAMPHENLFVDIGARGIFCLAILPNIIKGQILLEYERNNLMLSLLT